MLTPNQFILKQGPEVYGLHTFKDAKPDRYSTLICQLHPSGEWVTLRPPTPEQVKVFQQFGEKPNPAMKLSATIIRPHTESKLALNPSAPIVPMQTAPTVKTQTRPVSAMTGTLSPAQKAWETRRLRMAMKGL